MNNYKHLKHHKVLIQLSDGSSLKMYCNINKKEFLVESDIKSNLLWKNKPNLIDVNSLNTHLTNNYKKLFIK